MFQVHGVDARGQVAVRRRLGRWRVLAWFANLPGCLVGLEACGGAHPWARELTRRGHEVRLMRPQYVKAYVKTNSTMPQLPKRPTRLCSGPGCALCPSRARTARCCCCCTGGALS